MTPMGIIKNFVADDAIPKYRIIQFGAAETRVALAGGNTAMFGVSGVRGAIAADERIDVYLSDVQPIEYGAAVAAGDYLTADATGRAIPAAPAAGAQMQVIGRALQAGAQDAICDVLIAPQQITG